MGKFTQEFGKMSHPIVTQDYDSGQHDEYQRNGNYSGEQLVLPPHYNAYPYGISDKSPSCSAFAFGAPPAFSIAAFRSC